MSINFNPTSFLLLVGALAGNASIFGLDIFLLLSVPVFLLLAFGRLKQAGESPPLTMIFLAASPLLFFIVRAPEIGIPYFEQYRLWPIKSLLLAMFLVYQTRNPWPLGNDYLLAGLILFLLFAGEIEQGRFVSLFGPNMLYRFFGTLFLIGLIRAGATMGVSRTVAVVMSGIGIFGMSLTGSVGTIPLVLCAVYFARESVWKLFRSHAGPFVVFVGLAILWQFRGFFSNNLISRVQYKISNIDADERLFTWRRLADTDPGWFGLDYNRFTAIWTLRIPYPHNILIELWAFYGFVGFAVGILACYAYLDARKTNYYFYFVSIVILIGSMLSGDLSDNFAVLSFPVAYAATQSIRALNVRKQLASSLGANRNSVTIV